MLPAEGATPGETHDAKAALELTAAVAPKPRARLADKGYDTDNIRHAHCIQETLPLIPTKKNRKVQFAVDRALYGLRNRVRRYFSPIKNSRRIVTRYDKTTKSSSASGEIVSILNWLKFVNPI